MVNALYELLVKLGVPHHSTLTSTGSHEVNPVDRARSRPLVLVDCCCGIGLTSILVAAAFPEATVSLIERSSSFIILISSHPSTHSTAHSTWHR